MRTVSKTTKFVRLVILLLVLALARTAAAQGTFTLPIGWMGDLTFDGTFLYLTTMDGWRPIIKIDPATGLIVAVVDQTPFVTAAPRGVAFDGAGHLFLTSMSPAVCEADINGTVTNCFTVPDPVPNITADFRTGAIAFDGSNLYIGDTDAGTILVTDRFGAVIRHFESGLRPEGMVFDPSIGNLWVLDLFAANKMSEVGTSGELIRECEIPYTPGLYGLGGIAIKGSQFYISEPFNPASPGDGTTIHVVERSSLICTPAIVVHLSVDIKPGSNPNSINPRSKGVIPTAILTTDTVDAATVDAASVRFGKTGTEAAPVHSALDDVDGDGDADLILHFVTQQTGIACGDTSASLTGSTMGGEPVVGSDSIKTSGCK